MSSTRPTYVSPLESPWVLLTSSLPLQTTLNLAEAKVAEIENSLEALGDPTTLREKANDLQAKLNVNKEKLRKLKVTHARPFIGASYLLFSPE